MASMAKAFVKQCFDFIPFGARLRCALWVWFRKIRRMLRLIQIVRFGSVLQLVHWRCAVEDAGKRAPLRQIGLRGGYGSLNMRLSRVSSDFAVFEQIFLDEEFKAIRCIASPRVIVDLGANAGYASRYLLTAFPTARLIAVEPDPENVRVCRINLDPFGDRAVVRQAAVWDKTTELLLQPGKFGDGREWATRVRTASDGETPDVPAIDILTLIRDEDIDGIDLLKIDIEGSEWELFSSSRCQEWLPRVRNITIELHDKECHDSFFEALTGYRYIHRRSGELHVCLGLTPVAG